MHTHTHNQHTHVSLANKGSLHAHTEMYTLTGVKNSLLDFMALFGYLLIFLVIAF